MKLNFLGLCNSNRYGPEAIMNSARYPLLHKAEVTAGESSALKDRESPRLVRLKLIPALQTTIILRPPRPLEGRCREARE